MKELTLCLVSATFEPPPSLPFNIRGWFENMRSPAAPGHAPAYVVHNTPGGVNLGVIGSYHTGYLNTRHDILAFIHDDVICREEGWDLRVLKEFEDPRVGVVGFGGALLHGSADIYQRPYELQQLGRALYMSNVDDADVHGDRFTGSREVAVLDGFSLIVRRELLDRCGGWQPDKWPSHHVYDYRICCEAHRYGYSVRCVGIRCHHQGGRTATRADYQEWAKTTKWTSDVEMHTQGHRMLYDEYRDVLPWDARTPDAR